MRANKQRQRLAQRKRENRQKAIAASIRKWDDPILSVVCEPVIASDDLRFIRDLTDVLLATSDGAGLAAPQIGVAKRAFAMRENVGVSVFINPEIVDKGRNTASAVEGCLSYPGYGMRVSRFTKIKLAYADENGVRQERWLTGFAAVVAQHEMDHLNGICRVREAWLRSKSETTAA